MLFQSVTMVIMGQSAVVIGSGIGGLGVACILAKAGHKVTVLEKNSQLGGRAGQLRTHGFTFDTGPSWYLMPDIFEHFFELVGERVADHLDLVKLHPGYRVFYKGLGQHLDITGNPSTDQQTFESVEAGAGQKLKDYTAHAAYAYEYATSKLLYKNYDSVLGLMNRDFMQEARQMKLHQTINQHVRQYFTDQRLQQLLEYPLVFLGTDPSKGPAMYNMLSHLDFNQGVFYPMGGMYKVVEALVSIGKKYGVHYKTDTVVKRIIAKGGKATGVEAADGIVAADIIISNADIHHTETALLPNAYRDHSEKYWQKRTVGPSALLLFLGVDRQYDTLLHHNLLFSQLWRQNFKDIFDSPRLPTDPSLYVCAPSKTDPLVAPKGHENLFVLVPLAAGLSYTAQELRTYSDKILEILETEMHLPKLRQHVVYQKAFCVADFEEQFNSFRGSALGLSHTLLQTAMFRHSNRSKKVSNLYYAGAGVHPGVGVPSALISAELVYKRLINDSTANPLVSLSSAS